ncbi:hypothetical protein KQX54_014168 [Cotesia glomerata]|uniref:Uncharacterized protein n=1 Tax=Cotesia glomerata TaxID=32391 RepID=A0AAV7IQS6_COTGL|nr:hypothetical protein KQX54_014168 [Cotesia glomerata]
MIRAYSTDIPSRVAPRVSANKIEEHRSKLVGKTRTVVSVLNDAEQLRIFACKCAGDACKLFVRRHT